MGFQFPERSQENTPIVLCLLCCLKIIYHIFLIQEVAETAETPFMLRPPGAEELHTFEADESKSGSRAEKLRVRESWVTSWVVGTRLGFRSSPYVGRIDTRLLLLEGEGQTSRHTSSVRRLTKSVCFLCNRVGDGKEREGGGHGA